MARGRGGGKKGGKKGRETRNELELELKTHAEKSALPVAALEVSALSLLCQTAPL